MTSNAKKMSGTRAMVFCAMCVALMAVCAQIAVPLPIPFTMQTFAVFTAICLLDMKWAVFSIICYITMGGLGLPVFAGFKGGAQAVFGPTGGYMIGFVFAALLSGMLYRRTNRFSGRLLSLCAGLAVCYLFGTVWFMAVYSNDISLWSALMTCVIPFVIPDIIKAVLAILISDKLRSFL